jgi:hypothetical protein
MVSLGMTVTKTGMPAETGNPAEVGNPAETGNPESLAVTMTAYSIVIRICYDFDSAAECLQCL